MQAAATNGFAGSARSNCRAAGSGGFGAASSVMLRFYHNPLRGWRRFPRRSLRVGLEVLRVELEARDARLLVDLARVVVEARQLAVLVRNLELAQQLVHPPVALEVDVLVADHDGDREILLELLRILP